MPHIINDMMIRRCYLCGGEHSDSFDHIPPKNIFLKKNRIGLITIPAHKACNEGNKLDDEYFRYTLLIPAYWESKEARELWNEKIRFSIHHEKSIGFREYLLKKIERMGITTPGGIYLGDADAALLDAARMLNVIKRIARGLFYKHSKNILPLDWPIHADWLMPHVREGRRKLERMNRFISIGKGIFKYCLENSEKDTRDAFFWLCFFDCVDFWVISGGIPHSTEKHAPILSNVETPWAITFFR